MLYFRSVWIVVMLCSLHFGCATAPKAPTRQAQRPIQPKHGKVATPPAANVSNANTQTPAAKTVSEAEMLRFLAKHSSDTNAPMNEEDYVVLQNIDDMPKPGSLAEAVVVVGTAKLLAAKSQSARPADTFQEHGTNASTPAATPQSQLPEAAVPSLQNLLTTRGINLSLALSSNSMLKNLVVFDLIERAMQSGQNTPDFNTSVRTAMTTHAAQWARFAGKEAATPPSATTSIEPEPTNTANSNTQLSPADLRNADNILMEAQKLAANRMYADAITMAQRIQPGNPMYDLAQEKIKAFSNQAVQDLRQKAAQAFQSALPISDSKTRAAYLQQARTYLEQAIESFPRADQIGTVRENLAVITRDLEQVESESQE